MEDLPDRPPRTHRRRDWHHDPCRHDPGFAWLYRPSSHCRASRDATDRPRQSDALPDRAVVL